MIVGSCPYPGCKKAFLLEVRFGELPVPRIAVHKCHGCGGLIHTYVSLLNPESYTQKTFRKNYPELGPEDIQYPQPKEE